MNDLLLPAIQKSAQEIDPYYNLVSLHLKGDVNTGRNYNAFSDASSNNFRLTNNGDVRGSSFSPYGTSWSGFFGGGYITVPSGSAVTPTGTQSYCLEFFAYITGFSGTYDIFVEGSTNTNGFQIAYFNDGGASQGKLGVGASGVGSVNTATITGYLNKWVHVVATRSGNDHRLFFDGVLVAYASNAISFGARGTQAFGAQAAGTLPIDGYMSNIRVCLDAIPTSYQTSSTTVGTNVFSAVTSPLTTSSQGASSVALITCHANRFIDRDNGTGTVALALNGTLRISSFSPFLETDTTSGSGYFDGTGDYLQTASNAAFDLGTENFTLEFWVNPTSVTQTLISRQSSASGWGNIQWYLNIDASGTLVFTVSNGSTAGNLFANPNIPRNAWSHVAIVRNTNVWYVYLNGVSQSLATGASYSSSMEANATGQPFNIGGFTGWGLTTGNIADVRLVKGVPVYTGNFTPPTKPLSRSGSASASAYPSTTNVNTTFAESATSILTLQERGAYNTIGFQDESEYQHIITRNGNAAQGTFSPFSNAGWSAYYDGTTDNLTIASQAGLGFGTGDFCVEFWAYRLNTNSFIVLLQLNTYNTGLYIRTESTTYNDSFYFMNSSMNWDPATNFPANTWTHICVTRQTGKLRFFVNGKLIVSADNTSNMGAATADIGTSGFSGYLSNVRVIKGSVPAAYQTSNTTAGSQIFTPPTAPLTAVTGTELLTCQSNRLVDANTQTTPKAITRNGDVAATAFSPFKPPAYDPQVHGGSGYFDGTGDYLLITNISNLFDVGSAFTLETWIYTSTYNANNSYFVVGGTANDWNTSTGIYHQLYADGTNIYYQTSNGAGGTTNVISVARPTAGQWNHIVVGYNGTTTRMWINGSSVATSTSTYNKPSGTNRISIGAAVTGANASTGYLSNLRFVKADVYNVANSTITVSTTPLPLLDNTSLLLNFTNGGVIDSTGKNVIETVGNAGVVTTAIKKYGTGSMYFDGTGDYLFASPSQNFSFGTGDFTIEAWFYTAVGTNNAIFQISNTAGGFHTNYTNTIAIGLLSGKLNLFGVAGTGITSTGASYATSSWVHVALVRSSGVTKLYLNGTLDTTVGTSGSITDTTNYTMQYIIVGGYFSTSYLWNGYIDDLRITRGVARYTANFTAPTKALPDRGTASTLTTDLAAPSSVEALVVAGGGGGGYDRGAGGGAGGFREFIGTNAIAVSANTNYPVSIGIGGAGGTSSIVSGTAGGNSVFGTITSNGGGYGPAGGGSGVIGGTGGSGGGAAGGIGSALGGAGNKITGTTTDAPTQGNNGGASFGSSPYSSGGGGGAGGPGFAGTSTLGGAGGTGATSTISGSLVTYAIGGAGARDAGSGTTNTGGGPGGNSGGSGVAGTAGTANTGGGGGGGGNAPQANGGAGGSGVVILAYPTSFRPLKASLGLAYTIDTVTRPGYRVYKFTSGSGSISW